jgi:hypothetical protein
MSKGCHPAQSMIYYISHLDFVHKEQITLDAQGKRPWRFKKECCVALHSKPHGRHNSSTHVSMWQAEHETGGGVYVKTKGALPEKVRFFHT